MTRVVGLSVTVVLLVSLWARDIGASEPPASSNPADRGSSSASHTGAHQGGEPGHHTRDVGHGGTEVIDVNRPHSPFDCDLPIGVNWYGSTGRCLAELCGGQNVYNEYVFDGDNRRRRNPCYGQNPTEFPGD